MAFLGSVKRECEIRNRRNRNVRESNVPLRLNEYWSNASGQNFIVTGGSESQRIRVLAAAVRAARRRFRGPLIILNGSADYEKSFVSLAESGQAGSAVVSSPAYRNYDLFYGMSDISIRALFEKAARERGVSDLNAFGDYTEAFLKILKCKYTPCFHSMFAMARQSDQAIAEFGSAYRVTSIYLNYIKDGVAGSAFRRILTDYGKAFLNIHCKKFTGFNLSQIDGSDKTYLIWTNSESQELFNEVLAAELTCLRDTKGIRYSIILNDVNLAEDDPLKPVITVAKRRSALGVCCADVMAYVGDESIQKIITGYTPSLLVLNSGFEDHEDQMNILAKYGTYHHFEPTKEVTPSPGLFHKPGDGTLHMGMIQFERQRVTVEDMRGYAAAARGDYGDTVSLYRRIEDG